MTIFQLECFTALAQSLNFTQTADDVFISQSTLSRNISAIEHELGFQLLRRNTKTVELTPAGERFYSSASYILQCFRRGVTEARQAQDGLVGRLKLGIQQDAFEPFAVDLINSFRETYPDIELNLRPMSLHELHRSLNNGDLDIIIGAGQSSLEHPGRILLSSRTECVVLPVWHALAGRESIQMEELRNEHFVAMSTTASPSGNYLLMKYAAEAGFSPNIAATAESVPSLMMLVACGVGISILYKELEINAQGRLHFVPVEGLASFKRYLMWDEDSLNPVLHSFLQSAEEFVRNK